jgi:hypothetical protein
MLFFNKLIRNDEIRDRAENIFLYLSVLIISILLEPFQKGPVEICVFKNLTNLPCPGCGMTRSFVYAGHLDIVNSILMNPFGTILFLLWGWSALKDSVWLLFKKNLPFPPERIWTKGKTWFIAGLVIFGVIRMGFYITDFEPFQPLIKLINQLK